MLVLKYSGGTSVSQECLFLMNGCLLLSFSERMRGVHHMPKNQSSQFILLGSVQLYHFPYGLVHAPALSGWEASTVQQDTMAYINVVFTHGQLLWLLQEDRMVLFINPGLLLYYFSIHLDQSVTLRMEVVCYSETSEERSAHGIKAQKMTTI
jgi:hypothetical protein